MTEPVRVVTIDFASGAVDVAPYVVRATISRGRFDPLSTVIDAGTATFVLNNETRLFDPSYTSGTYYGELVPGRGVEITVDTLPIYTGFVDDWDLEYDVSLRSVASLKTTDALGVIGQTEMDAWTSSGTSVSAKLTAICDRAEVGWSGSLRDFDTGHELLQSHAVSSGTNALGYAKRVAESDQGYLFAAVDGALTYRDRLSRYGTSTVSFGGSGSQFLGVAASVGSEQLFARVGVTRDGGEQQVATVDDLAAWKVDYGPPRSLTIDNLLLSSDGRSLAIAEWLLSLYEAPRYRVSEITVELHALSDVQRAAVLALDITSVVDVSFTPNAVGSAITQNLLVQGIRHELTPESHRMTLSTIAVLSSTGDEWDIGVWGTAEWQ